MLGNKTNGILVMLVIASAATRGFGQPVCDQFSDRRLVIDRWAENRFVGTPNVIRDGNEYRMWLRSEFNVGFAGIFSTTSPDGISWTNVQPVLLPGPAGWESTHLYEGAVIKEGSVYKMWYTGYGGANNQIGYATSSDGINWTKYAGNPVVPLGAWDSRVVRVGSVIYDAAEGLYKMWYTGGSGWFHSLQVGYATSPDGINWTKSAAPVFTFGSTTDWINNHVNVIVHNGNYEMYYSSSTGDIRKATSVDGINWTVSPCSPVLEPAASGWDSNTVSEASVLWDNGVRKLWYLGHDGVGLHGGIGFAQSAWSDDFEDGVIDSSLWVVGGEKFGIGGCGSGSWAWSHEEIVAPDGYLSMRVWGPGSANTYGGQAWVRTLFNYNDGGNHLINFRWEADVNATHIDSYAIQVTAGTSPVCNLFWYNNHSDVAIDGPTWKNLYVNGNQPDRVPSDWSIHIDGTNNTATLFDGPDLSGTIILSKALPTDQPWHIRFIHQDGASAGFPAGDNLLNLYNFHSARMPAVSSVPTVPEWGMAVMTLLLLSVGTMVLNRRYQAAT